jgi:hypothetical protein
MIKYHLLRVFVINEQLVIVGKLERIIDLLVDGGELNSMESTLS